VLREATQIEVVNFLNILHGKRSNLESLVLELGMGELKDSRATISEAIGAKTWKRVIFERQ
jgi:hypothetical protein